MKKLVFLVALFSSLTAFAKPSVEIIVENKSSFDRDNEVVEFFPADITNKLNLKEDEQFIIVDKSGKQVPYQITQFFSKRVVNKDTITQGKVAVFQVSVKAKGKSTYTAKAGIPDFFASKTFARQVPERKDDFAWENDRIAFRMYGPALAPENPSNGVDIWLKRTDSLIVNKFYKNELENGISYHVDNGEGLDCYKVGHTLGAGGISPYLNNSLWVGGHYDNAQIIENGPLRSIFVLTYDSINVDNKKVKCTLTVSIDAGSQLNKAFVTYDNAPKDMLAAAGIFLHDGKGIVKENKEKGFIAYAEDAVSDAGVPSGRNYVGVIFKNGLKETIQTNEHILAIPSMYTVIPSKLILSYYFGAGWSKWGFATDDEWFTYMEQAVEKINNPMIVTVK
jgi:hypothetical protein